MLGDAENGGFINTTLGRTPAGAPKAGRRRLHSLAEWYNFQWWPVRQRSQFDPHGSERQRAGRGLWRERLGSGWIEWVGQPGAPEERGPRQRVGQAVGFVRLRLLVGVVAGVLGSLDRTSHVTAQAN